jgi:hypothetical protein
MHQVTVGATEFLSLVARRASDLPATNSRIGTARKPSGMTNQRALNPRKHVEEAFQTKQTIKTKEQRVLLLSPNSKYCLR